MSAWKYKQLTPKIIVSRLRLINSKDLTALCDKNFDAIHSMLAKTPYHREISDIPSDKLNSFTLESSLTKNFTRTFSEIIECSPKGIGSLLSAMQMKFEADNVKTMLRAKQANLNVDQAMEYIIPVARLNELYCRRKLESSRNTAELVEALADLDYGKILREAIGENEEPKPIQELETATDRYVYNRISKAAGKLRGLDGKIAKTVLGLEIDVVNLKIIFRCKTMGLEEHRAKKLLVHSSSVFEEEDVDKAIKASDIKSAAECLLAAAESAHARDHKYMLTDLLKELESSEAVSQLEKALDRSLLKTNLRMLKRYTSFFNIGSVLAFLNLKWFEVRNLRAIIRGTEAKVPADKIRKLLILPS